MVEEDDDDDEEKLFFCLHFFLLWYYDRVASREIIIDNSRGIRMDLNLSLGTYSSIWCSGN